MEDQYGTVNICISSAFFEACDSDAMLCRGRISILMRKVSWLLCRGVRLIQTQRNILVAHQFVTGADRSDSEETSVGGLDNVSAEVFEDFDYVALGTYPQTAEDGKRDFALQWNTA